MPPDASPPGHEDPASRQDIQLGAEVEKDSSTQHQHSGDNRPDHEWVPSGMWGPYPTGKCRHCNAGIICAVEGLPDPYDVIVKALAEVAP